MIGIISLLLFTTLGSGATIQTTSVTLSGTGEQAEIPVTLDTAANGLAGYRITAAIAPEGIAEIPLQEAKQVIAILDMNRFVEAQFLANPLEGFWSHPARTLGREQHRGRVSWHRVQCQEDHGYDEPQQDDPKTDPLEYEARHE